MLPVTTAMREPKGGGSLAGPLVASMAGASRQTVTHIDLVYPADLLNYQSSGRREWPT